MVIFSLKLLIYISFSSVLSLNKVVISQKFKYFLVFYVIAVLLRGLVCCELHGFDPIFLLFCCNTLFV